jgi:Mitosis protein DIM1
LVQIDLAGEAGGQQQAGSGSSSNEATVQPWPQGGVGSVESAGAERKEDKCEQESGPKQGGATGMPDQAIVNGDDRVVVVIRFGRDNDATCTVQDDVLASIAEKVKNFAVIYLVCKGTFRWHGRNAGATRSHPWFQQPLHLATVDWFESGSYLS